MPIFPARKEQVSNLIMHCTRMFLKYHRLITSITIGMSKEVSRVFQESFLGGFKDVSRKIEGCSNGVLSEFQGCLKEVQWGFEGSSQQGCFKEVLKVLQGRLRGVWRDL